MLDNIMTFWVVFCNLFLLLCTVSLHMTMTMIMAMSQIYDQCKCALFCAIHWFFIGIRNLIWLYDTDHSPMFNCGCRNYCYIFELLDSFLAAIITLPMVNFGRSLQLYYHCITVFYYILWFCVSLLHNIL